MCEMWFCLMTHSTHFIYGYMASDIWLRTILIVRKETRCRHIGYSFRLAARVLLYAPSHRQESTYHGLCYTSRGALDGMRNSSMGPPHEGSIRRPIAHERTLSYVPLPLRLKRNPWTMHGLVPVVQYPRDYTVRLGSVFVSAHPLSYFSFQPVLHEWCVIQSVG